MKLRYCRICGRKGIKFASDGCKYCGSAYVSDIEWQIKKEKGLTEGRILKKKAFKKSFKKKAIRITANTLIGTLGIIGWPLIILLICFIWAILIVYIIPFFFG